jgi:4'-phosphopantetheinyl transferase
MTIAPKFALVRPRPLRAGEIHVWSARLIESEARTAQFMSVLDRTEMARAARLASERVRMHFIQSHGMMRHILAKYTGAEPAKLKFRRGPGGKPHLIRSPNCPDLQFSLSHTNGRCMVAVALQHGVGIDIEELRQMPRGMDIARRHFVRSERRLVETLKDAQRDETFLTLWTCKEAVTKALGKDLAAILGTAAFEIDSNGWVQLSRVDHGRTCTHRCSVARVHSIPGYVAAVASIHPFRLVREYSCEL